MGNFTPDPEGLKRLAQKVAADQTRKLQGIVDRLGRQHHGTSVESIKPALKRAVTSAGFRTPDDQWLTKYATAISEGTTIKVKPGVIKM